MSAKPENSLEVVTFGCRLNAYESEVMRGLGQEAGLEDTVIINTCAVTAEAERQARQSIRKIRRERPDAKIIVTGCSAQVSPEMYDKMPEVDQILGNTEKMEKKTFLSKETPRVLVNDIMSIKETASHLVTHFEGRARAFVQIQNGCNHRCTFCTIPFGRGNNRSVPMGEIRDQVKALVEAGYQEVVFTGVDITDYGGDLPGKPSLGQMTRRVLSSVPELKALRLSSIDPIEMDEDVYKLLESEPRLMPHLHISLQAGDDMILKRMKRRHLRDDVIECCKRVRSLRPDAVFGADIIAGFPTETEEMFQNSLKIVEECGLTYLHVFPYSIRPGTPAARMPQVKKTDIKERAARLRALGKKQLISYLESQVGKTVDVLVENETSGRTPHYAPVALKGAGDLAGTFVRVKLVGVAEEKLVGEIL